ncbi:MAG: putative manganese-dependent inorganic diphosphatase [Coriobacteriales bacterium]|nr:putative manganese-dependent inorganic diphosphatase [Coriobacteriales bacterium]
MDHITVVGHRNPDNDSICSAVAYAHLKSQLDPTRHYQAVRLGPLPHETQWVFERYGIEAPPAIAHLFSTVADAMTTHIITINTNATLLDAGLLMRERNIRALVVTTCDGRYLGMFTTRMLAEIFISELELETSKQQTLSREVARYLDQRALILKPDTLLKEATEDILKAPLRQAVVLDDDGFCTGIVTRTDLARTPRKQVILVDHNEASQAALGVPEAQVVEVVDHHRIGDIQTTQPIPFINLPVGSTATIVTLEYRKHGIEPPQPIAAALLSAVMTDTVLLKSPTTTPIDHEVTAYLGAVLGLNALQFGIELFGSRDAAQPPTAATICNADAKEFSLADKTVLIAQYETVALPRALGLEPQIQEHLDALVAAKGYEFALLLLTDVLAEGSQFIVAGNPRIVERSFGISLASGSAWMPGILSRKKQVASRILEHG